MIAPARVAAVDALTLIDTGGVELGAAVARVRDSLADERDRALLLDIVTGTLRMRNALDHQLSQRLKRPLDKLDDAVLRILRLSAYQLLYQSRLPAAAIINDAVHLTRRAAKSSAAGLTNAVLRALSRNRHRLEWPPPANVIDHLSITHSHPRWLVERWVERYGAANTEAWVTFNNQAAPMCLAANRSTVSRELLQQELSAAGVETRFTSRAAHGLEVLEGRALHTAAFAEGRFVVQDEASQLIGELAGARPGDAVLDMCASPGGKTVALAAAVGPTGNVTAMDVRPNRVRLLFQTVERCNLMNVTVVHGPADQPLPFEPEQFDVVLVDAPCSGLGTVRRDPDIKWRRTAEDLPRFAAEQHRLLDRAAPLVKRGGALVYATCSSEPEENDQVVTAFLGRHSEFAIERRHQTLPFQDGLEAFFGAVLRRGIAERP